MSATEDRPSLSHPALRTKAIEALLLQKGVISEEAIDLFVKTYEHDVGPLNGARVVARAWVDPEFKRRLLENASDAMLEVGVGGFGAENVVAVENSENLHNVVVCTLCSCYPWAVLGLPPTWYKSPEYRARVVREPRAVLQEFGVELGSDVEVRVWDSSSEMRYLVLPMRPEGTEHMAEAELVQLVSRDSMVGTGLPQRGTA
ncbi:MAG TPA: nitrile hydratase subunit alpha [Mycobacterium sp.]